MVSDIDYVTARLVNFERTYGKGMPPTLVPGDGLSTNAMIARNRRPLSEVICYRCGKKGHFQSNCPELPPAGSNPARTLVATTSAPEVAELTQYYVSLFLCVVTFTSGSVECRAPTDCFGHDAIMGSALVS
ncbi:hypothetical protein EV361DRAFT_955811 [Lentinula raphanica]|nr:hypothetical protein EV361DRAFT_955811 [Lentinula raphanica]